MALLKEDGSLDIDKYESLSIEEWMDAMGDLTQDQVQEYISKAPLNESTGPIKPLKVGPTFDKGVDIDDIIKEFD